jgi:ribosomal protein L6P/L9E
MWSLGIGVWWSTAASLISSLLSKLKARSTYFENQVCTKDTLKDLDSEDLLEKASIVTTPTAYSDGVLHSVKPEQALGSELAVNGDFATDSDWNKAASWSISNNSANSDGTQSVGTLTQNTTSLAGKYFIEFQLKEYTQGNVGMSITGTGGQDIRVTNGVLGFYNTTITTPTDNFQIEIKGDSNFIGSIDNVSVKEVIGADFTFTRNNPGTRVNASGNIESVGVDLPRIDYRGGNGSWLLEPQATNTATDSNDFTTGDIFEGSSNPSATYAILTSAQATSPDGTNNAWKLVDNNDSGSGVTGFKYGGTHLVSNNYNTLSLFVKKQGNNDFIYISSKNYDPAAGGTTWFNISNGTLGTVASGHTASIDDYGNGWYRISVTLQTITDLLGQFQIYLATSNGNVSITRDGTNGVYIYGLQAESHAARQYATSYIPTSGYIQTRGVDSATNAGSSDLISSTEGVFYLEVAALNSINSYESISLSDGNIQNRIRFQFLNNLNEGAMQVQVGGVNQAFKSIDFTDITDFNKVAIKYKQNDFSVWLNGVKIHTDTSGPIPTLNQLNFSSGSNFNNFNGKVKCVAVFKEALTDAELTALTS